MLTKESRLRAIKHLLFLSQENSTSAAITSLVMTDEHQRIRIMKNQLVTVTCCSVPTGIQSFRREPQFGFDPPVLCSVPRLSVNG